MSSFSFKKLLKVMEYSGNTQACSIPLSAEEKFPWRCFWDTFIWLSVL